MDEDEESTLPGAGRNDPDDPTAGGVHDVVLVVAGLLAGILLVLVVVNLFGGDEPANEEPDEVTTEPTDDELTENEPTEGEPTEGEPTESEPTEQEPTGSEPTEQEPTASEPTEQEPTEQEPTESEPTDDEPVALPDYATFSRVEHATAPLAFDAPDGWVPASDGGRTGGEPPPVLSAAPDGTAAAVAAPALLAEAVAQAPATMPAVRTFDAFDNQPSDEVYDELLAGLLDEVPGECATVDRQPYEPEGSDLVGMLEVVEGCADADGNPTAVRWQHVAAATPAMDGFVLITVHVVEPRDEALLDRVAASLEVG